MIGTSNVLRIILYDSSIYAPERTAVKQDAVLLRISFACIEAELSRSLLAEEDDGHSSIGYYEYMCGSLVALGSLADCVCASERLAGLLLDSIDYLLLHGPPPPRSQSERARALASAAIALALLCTQHKRRGGANLMANVHAMPALRRAAAVLIHMLEQGPDAGDLDYWIHGTAVSLLRLLLDALGYKGTDSDG